jgi:hypothetical protein
VGETATGWTWIVPRNNGENAILASAKTHREAWHRAAEQARWLGMLGRGEAARA